MSRESCVHTPDTCIHTQGNLRLSVQSVLAIYPAGGRLPTLYRYISVAVTQSVYIHTNSTGFGPFCHFPRTLTMLTTECMITSKTVPYVSKLGPKFKRWALQQLLLGPTQVINAIRMRPARCSVSAHIP